MVKCINPDLKKQLEEKLKDFCQALDSTGKKPKYFEMVTNLNFALDEFGVLAQASLGDLCKANYLRPDQVSAPDLKIAQLDSILSIQMNLGLKLKNPKKKHAAEKLAAEVRQISTGIIREFEAVLQGFYKDHLWVEITKNLKLGEAHIDKVLADPQLFRKNYQHLQAVGLHEHPNYVQQMLDAPERFSRNCLRLERFGLNQPDNLAKTFENSEFGDFERHYSCLERLGLNSLENLKLLLDKPEQFDRNYLMLQTLGLDNKAQYVQKALSKPEQLAEDSQGLRKLLAVYKAIVTKIENNQFKVHGWGGGSEITFKGETRIVPKGVSKMWAQMTDEQGNFTWMDDLAAAVNQSKAQAESRQGSRGITGLTLWFGSYRDSQTKEMYKEMSQVLS
ncbi:hypothetical protein [Piscirickettsia salmonis]|uniref:hypothetical protein n=1 Tax=Piscirickettsia salmonis TaxID=1238 RepID=UPI0007D87EC1|nr:hypothetical protein A0O36_02827 [Piscirickettsiaceae bacterium NZ-RLO1]